MYNFLLAKNVIPRDEDVNKTTWSILNPHIFSGMGGSSCGGAMSLGDEYQPFFIFIALIIAGGERWVVSVQ